MIEETIKQVDRKNMVRVLRVRMDYLDNPVGITSVPQISWEIISDKKNVLQETYQMQVAKHMMPIAK